MAGLYIHIPFCKKACRYCDFHFSVSLNYKPEVIETIGIELINRLSELKSSISTLYFGGGTPSVLDSKELEYLMKIIYRERIKKNIEVTFEANPDDLTVKYLINLLESGINRLSIGIQSFNEKELVLLGRSHTVSQSYKAIENAFASGFTNINADLIYGIPGMKTDQLEKNLSILTGYHINHISAYHLTYEAGTVLDHWRKKGRITPLEEDQSFEQYMLVRSFLVEKGYEHYEISNFAKPGMISEHNSAYWKQVEYLGVGPSAHSYSGYTRRWNISSNKKYVENIKNGTPYFESEVLTPDNIYNEYLMTSFRTSRGIDTEYIKAKYGEERSLSLLNKMEKFLERGLIKNDNTIYTLSPEGWFLSDHIISGLFV